MKELTIEEKAQRYDEILARDKAEYAKFEGMLPGDVLEDVFSELKESESEDEKIRKELIRAFKSLHTIKLWHGIERTDIIAWLEKQHKQKDSVVDFKAKDWYVSNVDYKIHNMYYSVDKIEPKFKVGDWIVTKANNLYQIIAIVDNNYQLKYGDNYSIQKCADVDKNAKPWSINDAKDGDVLVYKDEISLYKHDIKNCTKQETTFGGFVYHCCYDGKRFITDSLYSLTEQDKTDIHPATKEQRDFLFQKMKKAGYEFNFEKKELKEINSSVLSSSSNIEGAIKAHAKTYSFNIESELFPQLTEEQQKLLRKEIEQACISGGDAGVSLARDLRYKENKEYIQTNIFIDKACKFLKDRIEHDSIDYPMATKYLVEDFKKYMKGE